MYRFVERGSRALIWGFAFLMALAAARYFYLSPPLVNGLEDHECGGQPSNPCSADPVDPSF
jgi:hypothetical protein